MTSLHIEWIHLSLLDVTNELGNTALDMCIMMVAPPDRRSDQIKLATFLLDKGADPNNRGRHDDDGSDDHHHDDSNDDNDDDSYDSDDDDDDDDERLSCNSPCLMVRQGRVQCHRPRGCQQRRRGHLSAAGVRSKCVTSQPHASGSEASHTETSKI